MVVSRICVFLAAFLFLLKLPPLWGEPLPVYDPDNLAAHSDLIVLGTEIGDGRIRIHRILKGHWPRKTIELSRYDQFRKSRGPLFRRGAEVAFTNRVVAFIDLRYEPRIAANGLFREGTADGQAGIFGYWQPINPGGYHVDPKPQFDDLDTLLSETERAVEAVPLMQQELLDKLTKDSDWVVSLAQITRKGDMDVVAAVARLPVTEARPVGWFLTFYSHVREPASWPFVAQLYEQTGEPQVLHLVGQLGHPDSHAFLAKKLIESESAIQALVYLHEALVERQDAINARQVARTIFDRYTEERARRRVPSAALAIAMQYRLDSDDEHVSRQLPWHVFEGKHVTDAYVREAIKKLRSVTELVFLNTSITDSALEAVGRLRDLEVLTFHRSQYPHEIAITDAGLRHLEELSKLKVFNVARSEVTSAGLAHLSELTNLEELKLNDTEVSDLTHLRSLARLKVLTLSDTGVDDAAMANLSELDRLEFLSLSHTKITDAGLVALQGLQHLRVLELSGTDVSDKGLEHLRDLVNLQHLYLSEANVTDAGLDHLFRLKNLKSLGVKECNVTPAGISRLREQLPKLRID